MACSPEQDQFMWPLEMKNVTRPNDEDARLADADGTQARKEWALADYVDPDDEEAQAQKEQSEEKNELVPSKPLDTGQVISKIRYFISEKQGNALIDSCW